MSVTIDRVLEMVRADVNPFDEGEQERTVRATIKALGLELAKNGEVYNPAPAANVSAPQGGNTFGYGDGGRRRRR